jgi:hypothetical protein
MPFLHLLNKIQEHKWPITIPTTQQHSTKLFKVVSAQLTRPNRPASLLRLLLSMHLAATTILAAKILGLLPLRQLNNLLLLLRQFLKLFLDNLLKGFSWQQQQSRQQAQLYFV